MDTAWTLCREYKYCAVCRRKNKDGLALRRSMRRMIDPGVDDFECPDKLPWLNEQLTQEGLEAFNRLADELEFNKVVKQENEITPRFSPDMINVLVAKTIEVKHLFPIDHPIIKALDGMVQGMTNPGGCSGCTRRRLLRQIAVVIDGCSDEERRRLLPLVTLT